MRVTRHIGKTAREHVAAESVGKNRARAAMGGRRKSEGMFAAVRAHRSFIPLLTVWGALLFGLVVLVLPGAMVARFSALSGIDVPLTALRLVIAGIFAVLGGALAFAAASVLRCAPAKGSADATVISAIKSRKPRSSEEIRPIDPAADLGSASLDAPIEDAALQAWMSVQSEADTVAEAPVREAEDEAVDPESGATRKPGKTSGSTLGELAQRGFEMEAPESFDEDDERDGRKGGWAFTRRHFKDALIESCEGASCAAAAERETATLAAKTPARPRALDLGEFGALPGRNAVWVEEPAPAATAPQAERESPTALRPEPVPASALEKLRRKPPEELSLVEMVERFAAALHDHQSTERARSTNARPGRDAALAEALKALSLFTERGFDWDGAACADETQISQTEHELRDALMRLQNLRGAA